jgi:hypothetical protein
MKHWSKKPYGILSPLMSTHCKLFLPFFTTVLLHYKCVQAVKEKIDTIGRYEKMAAERDRLIKDRAMIHKQLQEKERQLEEVLREVSLYDTSIINILFYFVYSHFYPFWTQVFRFD